MAGPYVAGTGVRLVMKVLIRLVVGSLAWVVLGLISPAQQQPRVNQVIPPTGSQIAVDQMIEVQFNAAMDDTTFSAAPNRFHVFGTQSGPISGTLTFLPGKKRAQFFPDADYVAGETVRMTLSNEILSLREINLRPAGYVFSFRVQTGSAGMDFRPVDGMSVKRMPGEPVRIYGGLGSDFDDDGFADLALINEDSGDFRMILNQGDGSGHFTFTTEEQLLGSRPSPGRVADFDHDGITDVVASNTQASDVAVLLGNGDGTFAAANNYFADGIPRGLGVIEANGDGFTDIVTSNFTTGAGNVALLINDGTGGFLPAVTFDSGITHEWAIDVADMNGDWIQDLIVGGRDSQTIAVLLGDGQGGYTLQSSRSSGGMTWRILCGDVNGDGTIDVTAANGLTGNACVALNDGLGNLAAPTVLATSGFSTDTDLGDLDGDGDLDWIVSNFNGRDYYLLENNGFGSFVLQDIWSAIDRPAGVVMMDFDLDQDLDIVLLDEIADYVTFLENQSGPTAVYCFGDGSGAACPCGNSGDPGHGCENLHSTRGVNVAATEVTRNGDGTSRTDLAVDGFNPAVGVPYLLIRSTTTVSGPVLGDGLACVGSPIVRLPLRIATGGADTYSLQHPLGPGTWYYQIIYRSQGAFCDPSQFNTSNGLAITWP